MEGSGKQPNLPEVLDAGHLTRFVGGTTGHWRVLRTRVLTGAGLAPVARLAIVGQGDDLPVEAAEWVLRGVTSYERYVTRPERQLLTARQERLGRPHATCAALILVAKSASWWDLPDGNGCSKKCAGKVTRPGRMEEWSKVRLPNGRVGWFRDQ